MGAVCGFDLRSVVPTSMRRPPSVKATLVAASGSEQAVRALVSKKADLVAENLALCHHNHEKGLGC